MPLFAPLRHFRLRLGLPLQFVFAILLVVILTSLMLTRFFVRSQITQLRQALTEKGDFLARNLAASSEYGVLTLHNDFLASLAAQATRHDDVAYAVVYGRNGKPLAVSDKSSRAYQQIQPHAVTALLDLHSGTKAADGREHTGVTGLTFVTEKGKAIYDVACPIVFHRSAGKREEIALMKRSGGGDERRIIGMVRVGISLDQTNRRILELKKGMLATLSIVILFGIALSVSLVIFIVRPLKQLEIGTRRLARGDLAYRVPVRFNDEIGDLTQAFNQMGEDLTNYVAELNGEKERALLLKQSLEQKTGELETALTKVKSMQQELIRVEKFATIGRLAASVAHELRNPLASLKNISYFLLRLGAFNDTRAQKMLEMMSVDIARANKIITDLLDFSGSKKMNRILVRIDEFITTHLATLTLPENVTLTKELEPVQAIIDPDRMAQALTNIIANACDAMPDGGQLTVTARQGGEHLVITVRDTGRGMNAETRARAFEPLFSTKTRGLGLGMPIVKDVVEMHFGKIQLQSEPEKGTTVEIIIPFKEE